MENIVILMGPTGAGKTVQGKRLAAALGWEHLSSGELLRLNAQMAPQLASGVLSPSADVERVLEKAVHNVVANRTIVLDGFPRMLDEAEWLESRLPEWKRTVSLVIVLEVTPDISGSRLMLRGRADDTPEALAEKWRAYNDETKPVLDFYERRGILSRIDGDGTEEEVYSRITKVFNI